MKKFITYLMLAVALILFIYWCIPKSCEPIGKHEQLTKKSKQSLHADSIETAITKKLNAKSDSIVKIYKDSIAKIQVQIINTKASYYALRKVVKQLQSVTVDSLGQTVKVPVDAYKASINSGNMCDSLIMFQDQELALKDSIISTREIQLVACGKENETKEQALSDLVALNNEEKKEKEKAKKSNIKFYGFGVFTIPAIYVIGKLAKVF